MVPDSGYGLLPWHPLFFPLADARRLLDQRLEPESEELFRLARRFIQLENGRRRPLRSIVNRFVSKLLQRPPVRSEPTMRPRRPFRRGHVGSVRTVGVGHEQVFAQEELER